MASTTLPIDALLPEVVSALQRCSNLVLRAATGAGKTTRVPPALLDGGLAQAHRVVMLEPRRLAARSAAGWMSHERGTQLGEEIGYQVRFERCAGPRTRILVVTPGIMLRIFQDDPYLERVGTIIFDEFHERSLECDLVLGMARLIQQTVRPELRIIVMSATIAVDAVSAYLDHCPVLSSEGRLFPVEIVYEPRSPQQALPPAMARAVERLSRHTTGDILAFLPGLNEIQRTAEELKPWAESFDFAVLPLHGDLPIDQQDVALRPQTRRRVVLATNVAETSLTVEGITGVVDSGLARVLHFDPAVGLDCLTLTPISKASADQRAGRAGRTRPGMCVRLWSEVAQRSRPEQTEPEIRRIDLAGAVLQLFAIGETDLIDFPWLDPPPPDKIEHAVTLLRRLDALDDSGLTPMGRQLARLPVHPRIGRLLVEGRALGDASRVALAGALLAERDPLNRLPSAPASLRRATTSSDVLDRVEILETFAATGTTNFDFGTLHRNGARHVLRVRDQLIRMLRQDEVSDQPQSPECDSDEIVLRSLLAAFPDRLAHRREPGSDRAVMLGGRGVRLASSSNVADAELFLAVNVDAAGSEMLVRQASAVERQWLPSDRVSTQVEVRFNESTQRVEAYKLTRYDDLVLAEVSAKLPSDKETAAVLVAAAAARLEKVLPAPDSPAGQYLTRCRCLREWLPELGLPDWNESDWLELVGWIAPGCRSFDDLRRANWLEAIQGKLTYERQQWIEREAPERITVPSGSAIVLTYELGRPPILAVRIQEMFGCIETPRVAQGRVKVLLHLLAPNYRAQQVTDDLPSFWIQTYPRIRGELRARYPKHAWPEDPVHAEPQRGPRRRKVQE